MRSGWGVKRHHIPVDENRARCDAVSWTELVLRTNNFLTPKTVLQSRKDTVRTVISFVTGRQGQL